MVGSSDRIEGSCNKICRDDYDNIEMIYFDELSLSSIE